MLDCPSGRLTKEEFVKIYEELFPSGRAKRFCESVFNVFDKNKTNTIGIYLILFKIHKKIFGNSFKIASVVNQF